MSVFDKLTASINNDNQSELAYFLGRLETKSGIKREYAVFAIAGLVSVILIMGDDTAGFLCHLIGILYPAYRSLKALHAATDKFFLMLTWYIYANMIKELTYWTFYWLMFAFVGLFDFACRQLPLYWLLKSILLLYLFSPITEGKESGLNLFTKLKLKYEGRGDNQQPVDINLNYDKSRVLNSTSSEEFAQKYSAAIDRVGSLREISPQPSTEQIDSAGSSFTSHNTGDSPSPEPVYTESTTQPNTSTAVEPSVKSNSNDIVTNYEENCDMVGSLLNAHQQPQPIREN